MRQTKGDETMMRKFQRHYAYWTAITHACDEVNFTNRNYGVNGCLYIVPCDDGKFAILGEGELKDDDHPIVRIGR